MNATRQYTRAQAAAIVRQREAYRQLGHTLKHSKNVQFVREDKKHPVADRWSPLTVKLFKEIAFIVASGTILWIAAAELAAL